MKKITTILCITLSLLISYTSAQNIQFGKISEEKGQLFKCIAGQIGNSIYTASFKGNDVFLNKCSAETMAIESSQKIITDGVDLKKNSWEVLKVDDKIVFIIGIWDKEAPNKILGKTIVDGDGKINADGGLKLIADWNSPVFEGKKITMIRDIKIIPSSEAEGLATTNNKIINELAVSHSCN